MPNSQTEDSATSFGPFRLFPKARLLEKNGDPVHIGGRALDVLIFLAERPGEVVNKRELVEHVWADVNVDEGSLRFHVTALRKVLGDNAARYVVNVPGRGYCFTAPVAPLAKSPAAQSAGLPASNHSLPAPLTKMIGRAEAVDKVSTALAQQRFVTIVGPGGIGKTSVAMAVAHRQLATFDGQVFPVDFGALKDTLLVPNAIASALGLTVSSDDPLPGLLTFLRDKRMMLVFDSCEHVLDTLAPLTETIVREATDLHVLATSRESFRTETEQVYRLFPLDCPPQRSGLSAADVLAYPAAQLFIERITAHLGEFQLSDRDAPLVADICTRLDGIALAIELAAGRVNAYGIAGIASLLNSRFSLLWHGRRTAVPRHQTLSAALAWSYDLLPPAESAVLRRLSIFVGPFTLDAAIAVAAGDGVSEPDVIETIANLVAKSLITTSSAVGPLRYRLLDTTRAFVAQKLADAGETDRVARVHARYFSALLADILIKPTTAARNAGFLPHAEHIANVRAALDWSFSDCGDRQIGVELAAAAAHFFLELSLLSECYRWCELALASLDASPIGPRQEMDLQAALGVSIMFTKGNTEAVHSAFVRSLDLARSLDDAHWQLWLLRGLHIYLTRIGDFAGALRVGEQGAVVAQVLNDPASTLNVEWMLGVAHHLIGNQAPAVALCQSAMTQNPSSQRLNILHLGYDDRIVALVALARSFWLTGQPDRAVEAARYTVAEAERLDQPLTIGISLVWTIYVFLWIGDWASAERMIERLIDHAAKHLLGPYHAVGIGQKGELLVRRGDVRAGIELLRRSQAMLDATRHRIMTTMFATASAEGLAAQGELDEALQTIDRAITRIGDGGETADLPEMFRVKGHILGLCGRTAEAETSLRRSLDIARHQSALGWELRTALTLGRLWQRSGRDHKARTLIAPLYARYEEGLGSLDLVAARTLLDALKP
ncbi:winged helix-turn-helix domain-containing protein [Bradyrhizobium sp. Tv2a-2]|uniref:ATP-binding protein n=1 Tax=Bradyrhizobium sp. Tv2a-2 TaxID=113395 RepID=UPI000413DB8B|nr:winged helix-turn-helix domain-containing protein [Bradyrhizobium sp. Tv2a-2]